jgi:diguanylate cyclase (GGDEF)-like protein/PAS domain S-box-containing protein
MRDNNDRNRLQEKVSQYQVNNRKKSNTQENEFKKIFHTINDIIYQEAQILITEPEGFIYYANEKFSTTLGYQPWELYGEHKSLFKTGLHSPQFYKNMRETLLSGEIWKGKIAMKRKDGTVTWNFMSVYPLFDSRKKIMNFLSIRTDRTEEKEYLDSLTGLPNYKHLDGCLSKEMEHAKENNALIVVAHLDFDDFKYVNSTFGRQNADQLLIDFSTRIGEVDRKICLFRPGGDEFIFIINDIHGFEEVVQIIANIHANINKKPYRMNGSDVHISASMGVSIYPYSGETKEVLLKNAEIAMYRAKKYGKNQYQIFSPTMNWSSYKQFTLRNDSKKALRNNEYFIDFQPRFNPVTSQIVAAEALIRWKHPNWGTVFPGEFISMAEDSGLIVQIGEWMITRVCHLIKEWQRENAAMKKISINLSSLQLLQPKFVERVSAILEDTFVQPKWLEFEITETVIIQKEQQVLHTLRDLRSLGITIALDDFGAGYSSLHYLSKFPYEVIKIDKSLIDNIHQDPDSYEIVSAIIHLCHKLRKTVVAEGVETEEQLSLLRELKCDEIQGYLFSKPVAEQVFRGYLRETTWKKTNTDL